MHHILNFVKKINHGFMRGFVFCLYYLGIGPAALIRFFMKKRQTEDAATFWHGKEENAAHDQAY
ncbi:MAG: hypothetical protein ACJKTH_02940 [Patescibacteria group bacterium UBA2163]